MKKPAYTHDCENCKHISTINAPAESRAKAIDIYACKKANEPTEYISRLSSEGSDYHCWNAGFLMMSQGKIARATRRELFAQGIITFNHPTE